MLFATCSASCAVRVPFFIAGQAIVYAQRWTDDYQQRQHRQIVNALENGRYDPSCRWLPHRPLFGLPIEEIFHAD